MRVKYGYKLFAAKNLPLPYPKRPFDKTKDFRPSMDKLFVYLTPTGLVSKTPRDRTSHITFSNYSDGFAYIFVHATYSWKLINPERIHIKDVI